MPQQNMTVFIVDDDQAVRESLEDLLDSVGINTRVFTSALDFLAAYSSDEPGCLVLDVRMPGMSGLELQQELNRQEIPLPVIILTGHGDVPMAVQAMKQGALDFIQKPFRDQDLLDQINHALHCSSGQCAKQHHIEEIKQRIQTLTRREHQIMQMIVAGKANKVIAIELDLSQRTVEVHRANVMHKLQVCSVADLVRVVTQVELGLDNTPHSL